MQETQLEGDVEITHGGGVVSAETTRTEKADATFVLASGIDSDAVVVVSDCVLQLDVADDELALQRTTACGHDVEQETAYGGGEADESSKRTLTFTSFFARPAGDGRIAIDAAGTIAEEARDVDDAKQTAELELTILFDGVLLAK